MPWGDVFYAPKIAYRFLKRGIDSVRTSVSSSLQELLSFETDYDRLFSELLKRRSFHLITDTEPMEGYVARLIYHQQNQWMLVLFDGESFRIIQDLEAKGTSPSTSFRNEVIDFFQSKPIDYINFFKLTNKFGHDFNKLEKLKQQLQTSGFLLKQGHEILLQTEVHSEQIKFSGELNEVFLDLFLQNHFLYVSDLELFPHAFTSKLIIYGIPALLFMQQMHQKFAIHHNRLGAGSVALASASLLQWLPTVSADFDCSKIVSYHSVVENSYRCSSVDIVQDNAKVNATIALYNTQVRPYDDCNDIRDDGGSDCGNSLYNHLIACGLSIEEALNVLMFRSEIGIQTCESIFKDIVSGAAKADRLEESLTNQLTSIQTFSTDSINSLSGSLQNIIKGLNSTQSLTSEQDASLKQLQAALLEQNGRLLIVETELKKASDTAESAKDQESNSNAALVLATLMLMFTIISIIFEVRGIIRDLQEEIQALLDKTNMLHFKLKKLEKALESTYIKHDLLLLKFLGVTGTYLSSFCKEKESNREIKKMLKAIYPTLGILAKKVVFSLNKKVYLLQPEIKEYLTEVRKEFETIVEGKLSPYVEEMEISLKEEFNLLKKILLKPENRNLQKAPYPTQITKEQIARFYKVRDILYKVYSYEIGLGKSDGHYQLQTKKQPAKQGALLEEFEDAHDTRDLQIDFAFLEIKKILTEIRENRLEFEKVLSQRTQLKKPPASGSDPELSYSGETSKPKSDIEAGPISKKPERGSEELHTEYEEILAHISNVTARVGKCIEQLEKSPLPEHLTQYAGTGKEKTSRFKEIILPKENQLSRTALQPDSPDSTVTTSGSSDSDSIEHSQSFFNLVQEVNRPLIHSRMPATTSGLFHKNTARPKLENIASQLSDEEVKIKRQAINTKIKSLEAKIIAARKDYPTLPVTLITNFPPLKEKILLLAQVKQFEDAEISLDKIEEYFINKLKQVQMDGPNGADSALMQPPTSHFVASQSNASEESERLHSQELTKHSKAHFHNVPEAVSSSGKSRAAWQDTPIENSGTDSKSVDAIAEQALPASSQRHRKESKNRAFKKSNKLTASSNPLSSFFKEKKSIDILTEEINTRLRSIAENIENNLASDEELAKIKSLYENKTLAINTLIERGNLDKATQILREFEIKIAGYIEKFAAKQAEKLSLFRRM